MKFFGEISLLYEFLDSRISSEIALFEYKIHRNECNKPSQCKLVCLPNAGSTMSFEWMRMIRRDDYLMRRSVEDGEEDDLVFVGRTRSRKTCDQLA